MNTGITVVWIDLKQAKVFTISEDCMAREVIRSPGRPDHHTHPRRNDAEDSEQMYDRVGSRLMDAKRILILGPGIARVHFLNRLKEVLPQVADRVVGCEPSDHPSDAQIAAYAMQYFHKPVA